MITVRKEKQLKSMLTKLRSDSDVLKKELALKNKEYSQKLNEINKLQEELKKLSQSNTGIKISEHALIRYFERVKGCNLKEIEEEILSDKIKNMIKVLGSTGKFPNDNGYMVVMKEGTVTTITNDNV